MKQGTISVLFGCHSPIHYTVVLIAWIKIYHKLPCFWELVCIYLHDIGHWGKDYLDDYSAKKRHAELGAKIANSLFGKKASDFILGHNAYEARQRSKLYYPDKYSWIIAPSIWMLSNQIFEPKLIRKGRGRMESVTMFKDAMRENEKTGFQEQGHDIYLKQWGHYK